MKSGALLPSNAECHRPIIFITEPRSGEVINLIGRWHEALLGNNAPLFIFISILIMTQLISFLWKNENKKFTRLTAVRTEALAYCQCASALISRNKALLVSVDLIGEKNQVILDYDIYIGQIAERRTSPVFAFRSGEWSVVFCTLKANMNRDFY